MNITRTPRRRRRLERRPSTTPQPLMRFELHPVLGSHLHSAAVQRHWRGW